MKRVYITLGVLLGFSMGAFAQNADLAAYVNLNQYECLNAGDTLQADTSVHNQPYGLWGAVNLGPDPIDSNQIVYMSTPHNQLIDSGLYFSGYYTEYAPADSWLRPISYFPVDSINTLLDIDAWENDTADRYYINLMVPKEHLVDGERYGFFVFVKGINDFDNPDNVDTSMANNNDYVAITWHCENNPDGIRGMLDEASRSIDIFPNPAQNDLHFKYGFIGQTDNAVARVIDMTGRVILTKNLGKHHFGTKEFSMDISSLRAGNYLLELSTGYVNAVGKFTVTK